MTYYTPLIILVLLSLAILCILTKENGRFTKDKKKILFFSYAVVGAAALSEWFGVQLNGNMNVPSWVLRVIKLFDYILTPLAGGAIILQFQTKSIWKRILTIVIGINTLYQLVSLFTGWMTTIDTENVYSHGPGYFVYIIIYFVIITLVIIEFALFGKQFHKQNRLSLYAAMLFTIVGIAMQEIMGGMVRTTYISLTMSMALLFIHNTEFDQLESDARIQEQQLRIAIDPLTGIPNRYAYNTAIQEMSALESLPPDLVVFSIDINSLKTVNDTFGHSAGDELICGASHCISSVFATYGTCYRTGGDEFIVIANVSKENILSLRTQLKQKAKEWQGKEASSLSFSIGAAEASSHPGVMIEKLISIADQEMYEEKDEFYNSTGLERRLF